MFTNWTKATTTTTGTGTLTLSAVTGYPLPSAALPVGTHIPYTILTSDGKFEAGIGLTAATNTLTRERILSTYDGTTYNMTSATALSLAAGTHSVIFGPVAEASPSAVLQVPPNSNLLHSCHMNTYSAANVGCVAVSRATCWPFLLESAVVVTGFGVNCAVAGGAGSITHAGLYGLTSTGAPGRLICTTTTSFDTSTTGAKTSTLGTSVRLTPGWYWVALVSSGGTGAPAFSGNTGHNRTPFGGVNGADSALVNVRYNTGTDTTLPDPFYTTSLVWVSGSSGAVPAIGLLTS